MEAATGTCKYCGKTQIIETSGGLSQEIVDDMVTQRCDCDDAIYHRTESEAFDSLVSIMRPFEDNQPYENYLMHEFETIAMAIFREHMSEAKFTMMDGDVIRIRKIKNSCEITRVRKKMRMETFEP